MTVQHIEKLQREYTDKYVVVSQDRPELARFKEHVGRVKTVNMSGRALVEFLDYHLNIGWFDIDVDYLKVVDKPKPKEKSATPADAPAAKKPVAKKPTPAGEKKLSPLEMARAADSKKRDAASEKPKSAGKLSTADILAAARGDGGGAATKSAKKEEPTPPKAKTTTPASGGATDRAKMSVADMLAAARAEKSGAATAKAPPEADRESTVPPPEEQAAEESPAVEDSAAEEESSADAAPAASVRVDRSSMSVDEMIAYCREHDG